MGTETGDGYQETDHNTQEDYLFRTQEVQSCEVAGQAYYTAQAKCCERKGVRKLSLTPLFGSTHTYASALPPREPIIPSKTHLLNTPGTRTEHRGHRGHGEYTRTRTQQVLGIVPYKHTNA